MTLTEGMVRFIQMILILEKFLLSLLETRNSRGAEHLAKRQHCLNEYRSQNDTR